MQHHAKEDYMSEFKSATIIIPAINETYLLTRTLEIIFETCDAADIGEIIYVLCKKTTPECIGTVDKLIAKYPQTPMRVYYQRESGLGCAYREAFELVKTSHAVTAAADMDMDPYAICRLIETAKREPSAMVCASRWIEGGGFEGYYKPKLVLNFIVQKALKIMYCSKLHDHTYGFRIYPTGLLKSIRWEETHHPIALETALKPIRLGVKTLEVPAMWRVRTEGDSQLAFSQCFIYLRTVFHVRFMKKSDILIGENRQ